MGAVVAVDIVLQTLMGLPADALPGEEKSDAIRELLTASACREVEAVGEGGLQGGNHAYREGRRPDRRRRPRRCGSGRGDALPNLLRRSTGTRPVCRTPLRARAPTLCFGVPMTVSFRLEHRVEQPS
jgi:hypothetical protein